MHIHAEIINFKKLPSLLLLPSYKHFSFFRSRASCENISSRIPFSVSSREEDEKNSNAMRGENSKCIQFQELRDKREREKEKFPWQEKLLEDIFLFSLYRNEHDKYGKWNSTENEFFLASLSFACAQFVYTFVLLLLCDDIERFRMLFLTIDSLWLLRSHFDMHEGVDLFWKY